MELHPALVAAGRFKVHACLGTGSYGVVFDVHDKDADAPVALKWLRNSDSATLARFKREFRSLADLLHPNLVGYRELFVVSGEWFFTMDLVEGVDFIRSVRTPAAMAVAREVDEEAIRSTGEVIVRTTLALELPEPGTRPSSSPKAPREATPLPQCAADLGHLKTGLEQLGAGLDALHAAGLIHRDMKPTNVLVTNDGRVVILDLGLVTEVGQDGIGVSKTGVVVGTPAYMSPEQALGKGIGPASDWYSVGAMLYEALTGRLPHMGTAQAQLIKKQMSDPDPPSALVRGIPPELDELCLALLSRSPEARPMGAVFAEWVARALGSSATSTLAPVSPRTPSFLPSEIPGSPRASLFPSDLVGRREQLAALRGAVEEATRGKAVVAFVHGASGMGKTALVRRFLDGLKRDQPAVMIFEGRCYERESVPYRALDSLVDAICRWLARLPEAEVTKLLPRDVEALARIFPVVSQLAVPARRRARGSIDVFEERRRAFEALRELLARLGDRSPLVLFIDDLQWGDADSEPLITTLLRLPDPPPMLFVAAYREEDAEAAPLVLALRRAAAQVGKRSFSAPGTPDGTSQIEGRDIAVGELTAETAFELATTLLAGRGGEELARTIAAESCGSPLFLRQLAALDHGGGRIDLPTAISARVAALPDDARRLLGVVAVAAQPMALALATRVAGTDQDPRGLFNRLRAETLVRSRGVEAGEIEIYHDRIRDIVVAALDVAEARAIHKQLARVLSMSGDEHAEAVARHFALADEQDLAAEFAEKAADRAATALAFGRAASMYEMALGLSKTTGGPTKALVVKLAEALVLAGRNREAASRFIDAAGDASELDAIELRRRAAEQLVLSGSLREGLTQIETLLVAMGMRAPGTILGVVVMLVLRRILLFVRGLRFRERNVDQLPREQLVRVDTCFTLGMGLGLLDPIRGAEYQTRSLMLALDAGEPERVARALALEALYRASDGVRRRPVVERLLTRAAALAERDDRPLSVARIRLVRGADAPLRRRVPAIAGGVRRGLGAPP
jgi:serine/threonine protein kinase